MDLKKGLQKRKAKREALQRNEQMKNMLAVIGLIMLGAILIPVVVGVVVSLPDIARYLRIRSM